MSENAEKKDIKGKIEDLTLSLKATTINIPFPQVAATSTQNYAMMASQYMPSHYPHHEQYEVLLVADDHTLREIERHVWPGAIKSMKALSYEGSKKVELRDAPPTEMKLVAAEKDEMRKMVREEMKGELTTMFEGFVENMLINFEVISAASVRKIVREEILRGASEVNIRDME